MSTHRKCSSYRFLCTAVVPLCLACLLRTMNKSEGAAQQNYAWRICLLWQSALCRLWKDERHKTNSWIIKRLQTSKGLYISVPRVHFSSHRQATQHGWPIRCHYCAAALDSLSWATMLRLHAETVHTCACCGAIKSIDPCGQECLTLPAPFTKWLNQLQLFSADGRHSFLFHVHGGCWSLWAC